MDRVNQPSKSTRGEPTIFPLILFFKHLFSWPSIPQIFSLIILAHNPPTFTITDPWPEKILKLWNSTLMLWKESLRNNRGWTRSQFIHVLRCWYSNPSTFTLQVLKLDTALRRQCLEKITIVDYSWNFWVGHLADPVYTFGHSSHSR